MKRDMDLVRSILFKVEDADGPVKANDLVTKEHGAAEIAHHLCIMANHGLVATSSEFTVYNGGEDVTGTVESLTWDGYDYIDAIRDHTVWAKTKDAVEKAVGSTTMDIFKETAKLIAMGAIKAQLGM